MADGTIIKSYPGGAGDHRSAGGRALQDRVLGRVRQERLSTGARDGAGQIQRAPQRS